MASQMNPEDAERVESIVQVLFVFNMISGQFVYWKEIYPLICDLVFC